MPNPAVRRSKPRLPRGERVAKMLDVTRAMLAEHALQARREPKAS